MKLSTSYKATLKDSNPVGPYHNQYPNPAGSDAAQFFESKDPRSWGINLRNFFEILLNIYQIGRFRSPKGQNKPQK